MSDLWNEVTPPAFTVQRVTTDGTGGDFVRGRPTTRQNALRYRAKSVTQNTASDKIAIKSSMTAVPSDYGVIELSWAWPEAYKNWTEVAIVRSGMGHPSTVNDGVTVFRAHNTTTVVNELDYQFYDDEGNPLTITIEDKNLQPGRWYYYTLFFLTTYWEPVMFAEALTPRNFGHFDHLFERVPEYYRWVDARFRGEQGYLQQFLKSFGFELDLTREYVESWQETYHFDNSPWPLLYQVGLNLGVGKDDGLGEIRSRSLISQINTLYDKRGTTAGIKGVIEAASKYETSLSSGRNLMLLPDDSEFVQGYGNWLLSEFGLPYNARHVSALAQARAFNASVSATYITYNITNVSLTSNVAEITTSVAHNFSTGNIVTVFGVDAIFNGTFTITATPTTTTFRYALTGADIASTLASGEAHVERNTLVTRTANYAGAVSTAYDAFIRYTSPDTRHVALTTLSSVGTVSSGITVSDVAPESGVGVLVVDVSDTFGTGDVSLTCGIGTADNGVEMSPRYNGIPVEPNIRYGFTCQYKYGSNGFIGAVNTQSSVTLGILWYDRNELLIGNDWYTVPVTGGWQEIVVYGVAPSTYTSITFGEAVGSAFDARTTGTLVAVAPAPISASLRYNSPTEAQYAIPYITVAERNSGDDFRMMGCMFYASGTAGEAAPLAPDIYLTLGTDELIGVASGKVMGG